MKFALIFLFFAALLVSCEKKDPSPELSDEIFKDLGTELGITDKNLELEIKDLEKSRAEYRQAVPQTGQIKHIQKKIDASVSKIDVLRQQKQFFEIRIEQRKEEVRSRYAESFRSGGRKWPDETELAIYRSTIKFNRDKIAWEKSRGVKKDVPRGTPDSADKKQESSE